jgi:hypothetical protein
MTVRVITSTSPDGLWKAEALLADPYNAQGTFVGDMDYARLTLTRADGSQGWSPYEEWTPTGLGDSFIDRFYWSADGRYLYFSHSGAADGCGNPFTTNLHRVDLQDGSLSEIPLDGIGVNELTVSPDADRMAYRTEDGLRVYDLESGEALTLPYNWPEGFDYLVGGYAWSPDGGQLAFTFTHNFCDFSEDVQTSIQIMDLESGEIRILADHDPRMLHVTSWPEPGKLQVIDRDGIRSILAIESGDLMPDDTPPDPVTLATQALNDFLNSLYWGASDSSQYERAVALYGGSYDTLVEMNPGVEPADHAVLFRNACRENGFQCLRVREVLSTELIPASGGTAEVRITVHLLSPDGSVFALGPCCGEETGEPQTEFVFTVRQIESGELKVFDLPPYRP